MSIIPKVDRETTLSDKAYTILRGAIIRNQLSPDQLLTEEQLARELGISRTPVKIALERLAFERLIRFNGGRGASVVEITEEDIRQVSDVRQAVEPLAARLAARHRDDGEAVALKALILAQRSAMEEGEYSLYLQIDYEIHTSVARMSRNEILLEIISNLSLQVQRFLILLRNLPESAPLATREHELLAEAIASGDPDAAERAMIEHVTKVSTRTFGSGPRPRATATFGSGS